MDGFGFAGPAYARAWWARSSCDRWATALVEEVRLGRVDPGSGTVLAAVAASDLPDRTAGVELLNVLRPTVAVAWLGTFAALQLASHPEWRDRLADPGAGRVRASFAQEVRRTTPFVPALTGLARVAVDVDGVTVRPGEHLVLDVIGVDHDPVRWSEPGRFDPSRFLTTWPGSFDLVPQGGGDAETGHRCPGESVALTLLDVTLEQLARVDLGVADARVDPTRMPTLPTGGLVAQVRPPGVAA